MRLRLDSRQLRSLVSVVEQAHDPKHHISALRNVLLEVAEDGLFRASTFSSWAVSYVDIAEPAYEPGTVSMPFERLAGVARSLHSGRIVEINVQDTKSVQVSSGASLWVLPQARSLKQFPPSPSEAFAEVGNILEGATVDFESFRRAVQTVLYAAPDPDAWPAFGALQFFDGVVVSAGPFRAHVAPCDIDPISHLRLPTAAAKALVSMVPSGSSDVRIVHTESAIWVLAANCVARVPKIQVPLNDLNDIYVDPLSLLGYRIRVDREDLASAVRRSQVTEASVTLRVQRVLGNLVSVDLTSRGEDTTYDSGDIHGEGDLGSVEAVEADLWTSHLLQAVQALSDDVVELRLPPTGGSMVAISDEGSTAILLQ